LKHLSDAEKRAFAIADNRLAELSSWDAPIVVDELEFLSQGDFSFDITITGFDTVDIDKLFASVHGAIDPRADEIPEFREREPPISNAGDLWILGRNRLLCGSALDSASYRRLLGDRQAQLVFTDPPWNVEVNGHVGGKGAVRHPEFVMASGEMTEDEFRGFLTAALKNAEQACVDGAILYVCMDWRHVDELRGAARAARLEQKNLCVWVKDNGGMGSFYRSQHELVFVFKSGRAPHVNNFGLGETGRYRTNVWSYPGVNSFRKGRLDDLTMHPTVKPVGLVADAIKDCSRRGDIVLDPFAGSGTTLIAAEKTGRVGCAIELDPRYVDVAIRRWEAVTGGTAKHAETGRTLLETAEATRGGETVEVVIPEQAEASHDR